MTQEELTRLREAAHGKIDAVANLATKISTIPSWGGGEQERAEFVAQQFRDRGYAPEIDEINNVYTRRGKRGGKAIMLLAHTDTVFPASTDMSVRREGDRIYGPSIGDNSVNVSAMINLFDLLDELKIETAVDLIATANVGEEGLGNLRGARAAVERYRDQLGAVLVIDGRQGDVLNQGVGSKRWRLTVTGPGGHSFGAFGLPSAIHGLGRIIAAIADLTVPSEPKTTFNVGIIEGGTSINTIAPSASALIDMRSVGVAELDSLADQVKTIIETKAGKGLETHIEVVGERPAGGRDENDPLIQKAMEVLRDLGFTPELRAGSTDANIPFSQNIPAVCVGVATGEGAHTIHEYIEVSSIGDGLAQVLRLVIEASELVAKG